MARNTGVTKYVFPEDETYVSPNGFVVEPSKKYNPKKIYAGETAESVLKKLVGQRDIVADKYARDEERIRGEADSFITKSKYNMLRDLATSAMSGNKESMDYVKALLGGM